MSSVVAILVAASVCCGPRSQAPATAAAVPAIPASQPAPITATLRVGDTHEVSGRKETVTFVGVTSDSRCPKGVTCVWEGDASVDLRVQAETAAVETVQLHTSDRFAREATAGGLRLRLESVEPYPEADRPIPAGEYRIVLSISTP